MICGVGVAGSRNSEGDQSLNVNEAQCCTVVVAIFHPQTSLERIFGEAEAKWWLNEIDCLIYLVVWQE